MIFFHYISAFLAKFWGIDPPGLGLWVLGDRSPWTMCVYSYVFQLKISHQNTFYKNHHIEFRAYLFRVFVMLDSTK